MTNGEPVTDDYPGARPYAFTGGTIKEVIVDVSGEAYLDLEKEAVAPEERPKIARVCGSM